jgi:hypothetical protein
LGSGGVAMITRRNLAVCLSLSLALLISLAAGQLSALAQGGFRPAGNYSDTGMLGSFSYNDSGSQTSIDVFANRQETVGPTGTTDETTLFLNVSVGFGVFNVNCFIDDTSTDFNVTAGADSAGLHKTIPQDAPGCGGNLTSDLVVDISWTGSGPIQSTRTSSRFACSGYTGETQGTDLGNAGQATFNITGLAAPVTAPDPQTFHRGSSLGHVQGAVPPDSCRGGVGRGAGRPTPAAGTYHTTFQNAFFNGSSGDGLTSLGMFAATSTSTSNPVRGGSTSSSETDLEFNLSSPLVSAGGCFVISSGDFQLSATSASLHTVLTSSTPACGGGSNVLPTDPFAIDVIWTGTAPVGTTMTDQQYACLNYHFQTSWVQVVDSVADAQVSMPGFTDSLPASGTIGSIDTRTHADGTPAAGCFFRG